MPTISKIRFANVIYEQGAKRYHDEIFHFDTHNGAVLLENGGGKTVFIQAALQAIIPHANVADRQIKDTLYLEDGPAHIAIEWLLNERPRQYVVSAVTVYTRNNKVETVRYVYEYSERDAHALENIPFTKHEGNLHYAASKDDMLSYYQAVVVQSPMRAKLFPQSIKAFTDYLEQNYFIIREEWENMIVMNSTEGGIEKVFEECKTTQELFDRLLIPSVETADKHYNPLSMADQFEKQRDNLKKYKEFNEKKLEYKMMEQKIDHYVDKFRLYHETAEQYKDEKHFAAAFYQYLVQQKNEAEQKVHDILQQLQTLKEQSSQLEQRQAALKIYEAQQQEQSLEEKLHYLQQQFEVLNRDFQTTVHEKHSLEFAMHRDKITKAKETIQLTKELLAKEGEKEDLNDLHNTLELLKGQWLYLLEHQKELTDRQIQDKLNQLQSIQIKQQQIEKELVKLQQELDTSKAEVTKHKTLMEESQKKLQTLKSELVSHEHEQVERLLKDWNVRAQQLEQSSRMTEDQMKFFAQQLKDKQLQFEDKVVRRHEVEQQLASLKTKQQTFEEEQQAVKESLRTVLHQLSATSLYDRATSYTNQLQEKITQLRMQKAEQLIVERKATRYVDDYAQQSQFFADPHIAQQIQQWSQFSTIQTGVEYLEALEQQLNAEVISYPFWAITLITTADEQQALRDKVQVNADKLSTPIIVLNREQARALALGEPFDESWVAPSFWQRHIQTASFLQWQINAQEEANRLENERLQIEEKLSHTEQVAQTLVQFLTKYSYEAYNALLLALEQTNQERQQLLFEGNALRNELTELQDTLQLKENQFEREKAELQFLQENRIPKATEYQTIQKNMYVHQQLKEQSDALVVSQEQQKKQLQEEIAGLVEQRDGLRDEQSHLQMNLELRVLQHPIYLEKDKLFARPAKQSEHMLSLEVARVQKAIDDTSESMRTLTERLQHYRQIVQDNERARNRKLEEYPTLDQKLAVPLEIDSYLQRLQQKIRQFEDKQQEQQEKVRTAEKAVQEISAKIKLLVEQYGETVPQQQGDLVQIQQQFEKDVEAHTNQTAFTEAEKLRFDQQAIKLTKAEGKMRDDYFIHQLNKIQSIEKSLSEEQQTAFLYDYAKEMKRISQQLEQRQIALQEQEQQIHLEKKRFRDFSAKLKDQKLRQVAVDGIENRHTYQEIIAHQQAMKTTIYHAVTMADTAIQEFDKDQQQIILYAVQQLKRVRQDLLEIPKRTRIRTETDAKVIFQFTIPDWEEHEAKEAIRHHIEWILTTLEQDKFRDEYGNEDYAAIRKFLEKHLQTVPLLRQVLGNRTMQVKCRKVESERQISSNYYNWEQSNQWSGGEKWSKNMALYLGVLKFIAEKSGSQTNAKRDRTLMLDNPFGKASSDHVLSPVFYIAEQLGFQLIALTAHAEGKYITDYFPVVYSCRLRFARNESHQVVQKEQLLNKAFFADHQPDALHYVGEKKQLSLFE